MFQLLKTISSGLISSWLRGKDSTLLRGKQMRNVPPFIGLLIDVRCKSQNISESSSSPNTVQFRSPLLGVCLLVLQVSLVSAVAGQQVPRTTRGEDVCECTPLKGVSDSPGCEEVGNPLTRAFPGVRLRGVLELVSLALQEMRC